MIKHIWSVLCLKSSVDNQTNNISLFDIFEQLEVKITKMEGVDIPEGKINIGLSYELVNYWVKIGSVGEEKIDIKIDLMDPSNTTIKTITKELIIPENIKRMREVNKIQGISISQSGIYWISVKIKNGENYEEKANVPFEVIINKISKEALS